MGVYYVPNFRSVSFFVWSGDVTQIHTQTNMQVKLGISSTGCSPHVDFDMDIKQHFYPLLPFLSRGGAPASLDCYYYCHQYKHLLMTCKYPANYQVNEPYTFTYHVTYTNRRTVTFHRGTKTLEKLKKPIFSQFLSQEGQ